MKRSKRSLLMLIVVSTILLIAGCDGIAISLPGLECKVAVAVNLDGSQVGKVNYCYDTVASRYTSLSCQSGTLLCTLEDGDACFTLNNSKVCIGRLQDPFDLVTN